MTTGLRIEMREDAAAVARRAAAVVASAGRNAVVARGRFILAVSGGSTPWAMLRALAAEKLDWEEVHIFQVDERVAPAGHRERNLTRLQTSLLAYAPLRPDRIHAMPVEAPDLEAGATQYARTLESVAGSPAAIDLVHLGLGSDGHTASLIPGDPVLEVTDADVGLTGVYHGWRRMTLTYPILNRCRQVLWVVTGSDKAGMLARLAAGDPSIPAGRVRRDNALVITDPAAAAALPPPPG
jgi:6-phosphogluconolactonase